MNRYNLNNIAVYVIPQNHSRIYELQQLTPNYITFLSEEKNKTVKMELLLLTDK